ncbi:hypothetical protein GIB67_001435 [Kingdonia uniflora]|uniref:Uncharacterized protein n=1 Tax=Kingdonia uniflora TaxID=39325 RepID=A0A7J7L6L7_9MAGN|nr:hypothetical protein GIB67_001435 [Kingdonia uniflora]
MQGKRRRVEPLGNSGEKVIEGRSTLIDDLKVVKERARLAILQGKEDTSQMVKLDVSRARKDHALMCNREFAEQFDRMKEANENSEDQYVKVYFRLEKLNQAVFDLTRQVKEKNFGIKKGLEDLTEAAERAGNLQRQVDALVIKGDVVSLSGRIRELESDVSQIQGHVQKGNTNLRECQHKLDAAPIREKVLEGEIRELRIC